ncbi:type II toxin-antitoxin system RelE/ParE family toxin [Muricoccus aerilatus]|uniref:type II toxin-antitoxin system RelE/ParE family toxin n=1 Tax=Muricoccus aerilatus TaxID=452982 RepID=UPI0005C208D3|nr:type II toxin-antitoxin system RelE/ParE family toxin [Roseomonas aerilata]
MPAVRQTDEYAAWFQALRDTSAKVRIFRRIERLSNGLMGDVKAVGAGVSEVRIDCGPGYRVYFAQRGTVLIVLLCGGDKDSQDRDIARAKALAADLED